MTTARATGTAAVLLTGTVLSSAALLVPSAWAAGSDLQLEPGARGAALFSAGALAPGHPVSRCVAVTASGSGGAPPDVRLYAQVAGPLAAGLVLRVELGSGGSYDDCAGFTGSSVFTGTLAGFGAQHADFASGLQQSTATATYRFTVELADDQQWQGLSATTQFRWEAQLDEPAAAVPPSPSATPSPVPSPSPSASPSPAPSAGAAPGPAAPGAPVAPGAGAGEPPAPPAEPVASPAEDEPPAAAAAASPAVPVPGPVGGDPSPDPGPPVELPPVPAAAGAPGPPADAGAPSMPLGRPRELPREAQQGAIARTAARVLETLRSSAIVAGQVASTGARAAGMPVGLVALVALFLVTQDRIDRSDPRLRLSPLHAPNTLEFSSGDAA